MHSALTAWLIFVAATLCHMVVVVVMLFQPMNDAPVTNVHHPQHNGDIFESQCNGGTSFCEGCDVCPTININP